jgi:hypothetical protein
LKARPEIVGSTASASPDFNFVPPGGDIMENLPHRSSQPSIRCWAFLPSGSVVDVTGLRVSDLSQQNVCGDFLAPADVRPSDLPEQFQAILGGPPFVRLQEMLQANVGQVRRYQSSYCTARSGQYERKCSARVIPLRTVTCSPIAMPWFAAGSLGCGCGTLSVRHPA